MSHEQLRRLLYPEGDGPGREERLRRLRQALADPRLREELAEELARRQAQRERQQEDADAAWNRAAHGDRSIDEDDDIVRAALELAGNLGARRPAPPPLYRGFWVPALMGLILGGLAVWMALSILPQLQRSSAPTFSAALQQLLERQRPSAEEQAQVASMLELYAQSGRAPQTGQARDFSQSVFKLLQQYHPDSGEIREAQHLIGVYHAPDVPPAP
jgi:hypothetical protein